MTHVVYTLNDYSVYRLSPRWLPEEFAFLKANLKEAIVTEDAEMVGEFQRRLYQPTWACVDGLLPRRRRTPAVACG